MKRSDFIFDSVQLMYDKCHKVNFKRGGLYIDSADQIKKRKSNNKSKNQNKKCFQHMATVALDYEEIKCYPE